MKLMGKTFNLNLQFHYFNSSYIYIYMLKILQFFLDNLIYIIILSMILFSLLVIFSVGNNELNNNTKIKKLIIIEK